MRTRFAPAPTGFLHLGHVLNASCIWDRARRERGEVLLRVEDHDRERARPAFEAALLDDLDWLGFAPDIFPTAAFRAGRCDGRQSDREVVYLEAAEHLRRAGLLYGCHCTRKMLASGRRSPAGEAVHDDSCRAKGLTAEPGVGWRVRLPEAPERFVDERLGPQLQDPARQCGDVLIRDRLGNWTYQFAVTVDDYAQGIDLVVRGVDLLESTGRQIALARLLGRESPPRFLHHGLIMKSASQKLSKSDGDRGVRDLRALGWSPEEVIAAARAAGAD